MEERKLTKIKCGWCQKNITNKTGVEYGKWCEKFFCNHDHYQKYHSDFMLKKGILFYGRPYPVKFNKEFLDVFNIELKDGLLYNKD